MAFLPPLVFQDLYTPRPSRLPNQKFGMGINEADLLMPFTIPQEINRSFAYFRPWRSQDSEKDIGSEILVDKNNFQISLDVQHFSPDEITVKATGDNTITVEAKHEERQDEHGYISRRFVRKYILPKHNDIKQVQSKFTSDGVLIITAPKANAGAIGDRRILIQQTGVPSKSFEMKEVGDKRK